MRQRRPFLRLFKLYFAFRFVSYFNSYFVRFVSYFVQICLEEWVGGHILRQRSPFLCLFKMLTVSSLAQLGSGTFWNILRLEKKIHFYNFFSFRPLTIQEIDAGSFLKCLLCVLSRPTGQRDFLKYPQTRKENTFLKYLQTSKENTYFCLLSSYHICTIPRNVKWYNFVWIAFFKC